jgi:hypothetical protein
MSTADRQVAHPTQVEDRPPHLNPSYYHAAPLVLTDEMRRMIAGAVGELDPKQLAIVRTLTPAERYEQAISMISLAEEVGAFRLRHRQPQLSEEEALRIVRSGVINYYRQKHDHQAT